MADLELIPLTVTEGMWHGLLRPSDPKGGAPQVQVTHLDRPVPGVKVAPDADRGGWHLSFPLPPQILSDGVQTILISDPGGARLGAFTIAMGDALEGDIRAEIDLLRAELDMLKRAFRRHCVETG